MQTDLTLAAVRSQRRVGREVEAGDQFREEDPRPPPFRQDIGVLAIPAKAGALGHRAVYHAPGVAEDDALLVFRRRQFAHVFGERVQLAADDLVVVIAPGVGGNPPVWLPGRGEIARGVGQIEEPQRHHRARGRQQRAWIARHLGALSRQPVHPREEVRRDARLQRLLGLRERLGAGDAHEIEAQIVGALADALRQRLAGHLAWINPGNVHIVLSPGR